MEEKYLDQKQETNLSNHLHMFNGASVFPEAPLQKNCQSSLKEADHKVKPHLQRLRPLEFMQLTIFLPDDKLCAFLISLSALI